jgi:lysophospholipase L1-like esterase
MRILCFGDSNTWGFDPRDTLGGRYPADSRWVDILARETGWEVRNEGINGRQIPRNPYPLRLLQNCDPGVIFLVMLGTNDLLQGADAKEPAARMEVFLTAMHPHCKRLLLVAPPPMKRGAWVPSDELAAESIHLAEEYRRLAEKQNIPFVDTREWDIPLAFDGVHFTEEGHHRFAAHLMQALQNTAPSSQL